MTKTFQNFILSKKNIIIFWFMALFFQSFITQPILNLSIRSIIWYILWVINGLWGTIILFNDIKNNTFTLKDKRILFLFLFVLISSISWLFCQKNHGPYYIFSLFTLYEQTFIFYTYTINSKIENIKNLLHTIANSYVFLVTIYTILSLAFYLSGNTLITLPNGSVISMIGVDDDLVHTTRFMGLWTWFTTASFDCYIVILLGLYMIDNCDNYKNKIIYIISIILNTYMLYLTESRTSFIILFIIFLAGISFLLKNEIGFKKIILYEFIVFMISIFTVLFIKIKHNPQILKSFINDPYQTLNFFSSGRIQMMNIILLNIKKFWLLGCGYGNLEISYALYGIKHPHNFIFATILYSGLTGLVLLISFFISNIKSILQNIHLLDKNKMRWILVLIACIFIEGTFDICIIGAPLNIQTYIFWLCLGIISFIH